MSEVTTTKSRFVQAAQESRRAKNVQILTDVLRKEDAKNEQLGSILDELESANSEMLQDFRSLTISELVTMLVPPAAAKSRKTKTESPDVKVPNWSPETLAAHAEKVLAFLADKGLGEGTHPRGFTPQELREALTGDEGQMREVLAALTSAGKVHSTGKTKGLRYVVKGLAAKADAAFQAFVADKTKQEQEKAARKATAEAEGKPAKGGKGKGSAKA